MAGWFGLSAFAASRVAAVGAQSCPCTVVPALNRVTFSTFRKQKLQNARQLLNAPTSYLREIGGSCEVDIALAEVNPTLPIQPKNIGHEADESRNGAKDNIVHDTLPQ
eukprot:212712-Pelagomonas_calceolata.AAC.1